MSIRNGIVVVVNMMSPMTFYSVRTDDSMIILNIAPTRIQKHVCSAHSRSIPTYQHWPLRIAQEADRRCR
jgi:hypothetical protein